jgi:hypothetical protein
MSEPMELVVIDPVATNGMREKRNNTRGTM